MSFFISATKHFLNMETEKRKICTKCKMSLPATSEYFHVRKDRKSGFQSRCKKCRNTKNRAYYKENSESLIEKRKLYYKEHRDEIREYDKLRSKKRYDSNPEFFIKYTNTHKWIRHHKDKAKYCVICNEKRKLQLANISGDYKKDINDYLWLCQDCHLLFDFCKKNIDFTPKNYIKIKTTKKEGIGR